MSPLGRQSGSERQREHCERGSLCRTFSSSILTPSMPSMLEKTPSMSAICLSFVSTRSMRSRSDAKSAALSVPLSLSLSTSSSASPSPPPPPAPRADAEARRGGRSRDWRALRAPARCKGAPTRRSGARRARSMPPAPARLCACLPAATHATRAPPSSRRSLVSVHTDTPLYTDTPRVHRHASCQPLCSLHAAPAAFVLSFLQGALLPACPRPLVTPLVGAAREGDERPSPRPRRSREAQGNAQQQWQGLRTRTRRQAE